jgi:uncharacterized DUF497 family protein
MGNIKGLVAKHFVYAYNIHVGLFENFEGFDWDQGNIDKSYKKHSVNLNECEEVFFNEPVFVFYDQRHSKVEERYYLLGKTNTGSLLFVVFTKRGSLIRIISARPANKKERTIYYEKAKKYS